MDRRRVVLFGGSALAILLFLVAVVSVGGSDRGTTTGSGTTATVAPGSSTTAVAPPPSTAPALICGGAFSRACYEGVVAEAETDAYQGAALTADQVACVTAATAARLTDDQLRIYVEVVLGEGAPLAGVAEVADPVGIARAEASAACGT